MPNVSSEADKKLSLVAQTSSSPRHKKDIQREKFEDNFIRVEEASFIAAEMSLEMNPSEFEADNEEDMQQVTDPVNDPELLKKIDDVLAEHYVKEKVANGGDLEGMRNRLLTKIMS